MAYPCVAYSVIYKGEVGLVVWVFGLGWNGVVVLGPFVEFTGGDGRGRGGRRGSL